MNHFIENCRPDQIRPTGTRHWIVNGSGRGSGVTYAGTADCIARILSGEAKRVLVASENFDMARRICVEGHSGLVECAPEDIVRYMRTGQVVFSNGSGVTIAGADSSRIRGMKFDHIWCDNWGMCRSEDRDEMVLRLAMDGTSCWTGFDIEGVVPTPPYEILSRGYTLTRLGMKMSVS